MTLKEKIKNLADDARDVAKEVVEKGKSEVKKRSKDVIAGAKSGYFTYKNCRKRRQEK